ncbi:hypothetical protein OHD16_10520 [Sphingobacterium sp. ML3W]|uniref:hypothetical protein n=1 Tax=Sphingobacterium sp. ML3W TaxID=1538644 RepID=UPI00249AF51C|nr:hypothetical protein [Sphingobacterium sp. ML3W]WFA80394.1 hypothetical protein OGI71_03665 [Sphingobacterium sp. ML3W]
MEYGSFLRLDNTASAKEALAEIKDICDENFSSKIAGKLLIGEILGLFHEALETDDKGFLEKIFFENQKYLRLTYDHQDFIFHQWDDIKSKMDQMNRFMQMQLVNLYRNIISDLFDPYLSIIIAAIRFKEGTFSSFNQANLSASEFQKVQFASSRLKGTSMFSGYVPIIRNAISHSGTHSIVYQADHIVFRKIQRTTVPVITDILKLTNQELIDRIASLIDFITAVYASINIFGVDVQPIITNDQTLSSLYIHQVADKNSVKFLRDKKDQEILEKWNDPKLTGKQKEEFFAEKFTKNCNFNKMPAISIELLKKDKILLINVPHKLVGTKNLKIINRAVALVKYALLAEPLFNFEYDSFLVAESPIEGSDSFQIWLKGEDLKNYDLHEIGLYELIDKASFYRNKEDFPLTVDFSEVEKEELYSFEPRKKRT